MAVSLLFRWIPKAHHPAPQVLTDECAVNSYCSVQDIKWYAFAINILHVLKLLFFNAKLNTWRMMDQVKHMCTVSSDGAPLHLWPQCQRTASLCPCNEHHRMWFYTSWCEKGLNARILTEWLESYTELPIFLAKHKPKHDSSTINRTVKSFN